MTEVPPRLWDPVREHNDYADGLNAAELNFLENPYFLRLRESSSQTEPALFHAQNCVSGSP